MLRQPRSERGETFIELIVSAALLGLLGLGMLTALSSTIIVSRADRSFAGTETVLRSFATALERRPYKNCTSNSSANPYTAADLAFSAPSGFTTSVTSVEFLDNQNTAALSDANFVSTCPSTGDQGVQQFMIRATQTDGGAQQDARVLLRRGDS